jgi:predicted transcriptional regulator
MTTRSALQKRLLERRKDGRAFWHSPVSPEEFEHGIRADFVNSLRARCDGSPVLACIVDTVSERDREMLDELERLVKAKKRELKGKAD